MYGIWQGDESIILKWKDEAESDFKKFVIFYVPRQGQTELDTKNQDSWKSWLELFCRGKSIVFIDSTQDLIKTEVLGKEVFCDHFTIYGHRAFSASFVKWFKENHPI
mgnify:CR=1 FL=1